MKFGLGSTLAVLLAACGRKLSEITPTAAPSAPAPGATLAADRTTGAPTASAAPAPRPTYPPFDYPSDVTITPIERFYQYTHVPIDPPVIPDFRLRIYGQVRNELSLTLDELKAMPVIEEMRTLECISNPVGGNLISNAVWRGAPMAHLLDLAGVTPRAVELKFDCADGYDTTIPVELALDPHSFLAYWMNGVPLPPEHGHPLRALWPGRYGQKQPKWITGIELIAEPHLGYWERLGWSNEAIIVPNSRIDQPKQSSVVQLPTVISGIAFANASGVAKLEVSADDGVTWRAAELTRGPSPLAWTEWRYEWSEAAPGSYRLRARVTDGEGRRQRIGTNQILSGVKPDGTDAQHTVAVTVKKN